MNTARPTASFGWFANIGNAREEIGSAMSGGNVSGVIPFLPSGVGASKSIPTGGTNFFATPTSVEIGTPGGGAGVSGSQEIPCQFCAQMRQSMLDSRMNPYNFRRSQ